MQTNLYAYAKKVSDDIKKNGRTSMYHWTELSTLIDELIKYSDKSIAMGEYKENDTDINTTGKQDSPSETRARAS